MKRIKLFTAALLLAAISAGNDVWALSDSRKKDTRPVESPQFFSGNANPVGFHFCGRPDIGGIQRKALCVWNQ